MKIKYLFVIVCFVFAADANAQNTTLWLPQITRNPAPLTPIKAQQLKEMGDMQTLAAHQLDAGNYKAAELDARQAISISYGSGFSLEILASALEAEGKTSEAMQVYHKMVYEWGFSQARVLLPYAKLLAESGDYISALNVYTAALPTMPDGDILRLYSPTSYSTSNASEIKSDIEIGMSFVYSWQASLGGRDQHSKAMTMLNSAIDRSPNSPVANIYYGRALANFGRRVESKPYFQKAFDLSSGALKKQAGIELARNLR